MAGVGCMLGNHGVAILLLDLYVRARKEPVDGEWRRGWKDGWPRHKCLRMKATATFGLVDKSSGIEHLIAHVTSRGPAGDQGGRRFTRAARSRQGGGKTFGDELWSLQVIPYRGGSDCRPYETSGWLFRTRPAP